MLKLQEFFKKHARHIATYVFLIGFIFDAINLPDVNNPLTQYLGIFYLVLISLVLFAREYVVSRNTASVMEQRIYSLLTIVISLTSGALLSFVFIYYTRSAEFSVSWPLLLGIVFIMMANEFISTHSFRFLLDIIVLLVGNIFFFIFNIPLLIGKQNDTIFAVSVIVATLIALLYIYILKYSSEMAREVAGTAQALAVFIPIVVFLLYSTNILPAVPLSLADAEVYTSVKKGDDGHFVVSEEAKTHSFASYIFDPTFHYKEGEGLYFFSSIHAPAKLEAPISHVWEYYDEKNNKWVSNLVVSFSITGGRETGYRGYSKKENLFPGLWRVTVKVGEKRIVGRMEFHVLKDEGTTQIVEKTI